MSKKKNTNKKTKILLSTLVPIGCVGVTLAIVVPLVVKCGGKATLKSKKDAENYLNKHKKVHYDDVHGESPTDETTALGFWDTNNYGSQNMINFGVYAYSLEWSNAHIKKMVIDVQKNKFSFDCEFDQMLQVRAGIMQLKHLSVEGADNNSRKIFNCETNEGEKVQSIITSYIGYDPLKIGHHFYRVIRSTHQGTNPDDVFGFYYELSILMGQVENNNSLIILS